MDILFTWYQVYIEAELCSIICCVKRKNEHNSSGWDEGDGGRVVEVGGGWDVEADNGRQKINRHWYLLLIDWCLDWNLFKLSKIECLI